MKLAYLYIVAQKTGVPLEFAVAADVISAEDVQTSAMSVDVAARKIATDILKVHTFSDERIHYVRIIPLFTEAGEVLA